MSYRIEQKLFIEKNYIIDFKKFINENFVKKIYEPRVIESLYFDNKEKEMYKDSIEGSVPRKKIRLRYYPSENSKEIFLEKKISSVEGRFKKRKLINREDFENLKNNGIFDNNYGRCTPKIFVTYNREYYRVGDVRVTVDQNIRYREYKKDIIKKDHNLIVELKTKFNKDLDELTQQFPFQKIRFSKFCNGLDLFA